MKTRTIFLSMLAAATFVSCSKDVADNPDINPEPFTGKAYISFSVNNGSSNVTKAKTAQRWRVKQPQLQQSCSMKTVYA